MNDNLKEEIMVLSQELDKIVIALDRVGIALAPLADKLNRISSRISCTTAVPPPS